MHKQLFAHHVSATPNQLFVIVTTYTRYVVPGIFKVSQYYTFTLSTNIQLLMTQIEGSLYDTPCVIVITGIGRAHTISRRTMRYWAKQSTCRSFYVTLTHMLRWLLASHWLKGIYKWIFLEWYLRMNKQSSGTPFLWWGDHQNGNVARTCWWSVTWIHKDLPAQCNRMHLLNIMYTTFLSSYHFLSWPFWGIYFSFNKKKLLLMRLSKITAG